MLSDSWKSAFEMALENPQNNIAKKYEKTWNFPASLAISKAFTIHPTNLLRQFVFIVSVFLSFNFILVTRLPVV